MTSPPFFIAFPDWMTAASCLQYVPDDWFPVDSDNGAAQRAKAICRECPVKTECLEAALVNNEAHGIWGALTPRERRKLQKGEAA